MQKSKILHRQDSDDGDDNKKFDQGKAEELYPPMGGGNTLFHKFDFPFLLYCSLIFSKLCLY